MEVTIKDNEALETKHGRNSKVSVNNVVNKGIRQ
jgi:hypothetical protein